MYREAGERAATPRTKVVYRASLLRFQGVVFAILMPLAGAVLLSLVHATHVSCSRAEATCAVTSHSLFIPFARRVVPLDEVVELTFDMRKSAKGGMYADAWLVTKSLGRLPMNDAILTKRTDAGDANVSATELKAFLDDMQKPGVDAAERSGAAEAGGGFGGRKPPNRVDVWLWPPHLGTIFTTILGLLVMLAAQSVVREQIGQLFPIRVIIDHDAKTLLLPRRNTVRFDDVTEVGIQHGRALGWASGKGEHIPGYRIIVRLANGKVIPLTRDHRVGPAELHENAKKDILRAMGRES